MGRIASALGLLLALSTPVRAADAPADPPWVADVLGAYYGTVRNAGRMECHRTVLSLQDGHLVGHYWIDDADPFEGALTDFTPDSDGSGSFTWTDRYGTGVERLVFATDHAGFTGSWGTDRPDSRNPVYGQRSRTTACEPQTSDAGRDASQS